MGRIKILLTTKVADIPIIAGFLPTTMARALIGTPMNDAANVMAAATTTSVSSADCPSPLASDTQPIAKPEDINGMFTGEKFR